MKTRTLGLLALGIYVILVACLIATFVCFRDNEETMLLGMYTVSTVLMVITMIFAVLFLRNGASDRYSEMYAEEDDWEKR